jgi:methyl coenzyme M reductase subunit C-like uncharacterized protein (methanogenesis marker protein 7)
LLPNAFSRQLSCREKALAEDSTFSGMPLEFEQWYKTSWLPANLGRDSYRMQAETHIQGLANMIRCLQKEIEDRSGNLLNERDRMIQQRLWLQNELGNFGVR